MVKTHKQYYLHNMRSPYVPTNRRLHTERQREWETVIERIRERERDRKRGRKRERGREMKW